MSKKLIAGIIAGIAVIVAAVIIILTLSGKLELNLIKGSKKDNSSVTSSQQDKNQEKTETDDGAASSASKEKTDMAEKDTGEKSVKVADVEAKKDSKSISVPIYVNKNDGMCAAKICVEFDTEHFDYADVTKGTMFGSVTGNFKDGKAYIVAYSDDGISDVKGAGTAADLVLVPKKGTKAGTYKVTVKQSESEFANINEQFVKPDVQTGNIVIK